MFRFQLNRCDGGSQTMGKSAADFRQQARQLRSEALSRGSMGEGAVTTLLNRLIGATWQGRLALNFLFRAEKARVADWCDLVADNMDRGMTLEDAVRSASREMD